MILYAMMKQYIEKIEKNNIVSKTDTEGIITFVSDEFCTISGFTRDELIGKKHNLIKHPDMQEESFKEMWDTILNKEIYKGTIKNLSKNKKTFYLNTIIFPILDKSDKIIQFVALRYDVTETFIANEKLEIKDKELKTLNLMLEEKVKKQTIELLNLNRNLKKRIKIEVEKSSKRERIMFFQARFASMGEMIGNIAHQWRQPLNNLNITLYKMKKEFNKDEKEFNKIYKEAKNLTKKMSDTIDDFRNFFKPDKEIETFYMNEVINQAYLLLEKTLYNENIKISFTLSENFRLKGYPNEFSHVIINIINNSRDALQGEKGRKLINIETKILNDKKLKECVCISITDNGGGIGDKNIDKVFEPYFTTKHQSSGTGIGLYMCKQIIESSMHGSISVKNKKNGACFIIKIPYSNSGGV